MNEKTRNQNNSFQSPSGLQQKSSHFASRPSSDRSTQVQRSRFNSRPSTNETNNQLQASPAPGLSLAKISVYPPINQVVKVVKQKWRK